MADKSLRKRLAGIFGDNAGKRFLKGKQTKEDEAKFLVNVAEDRKRKHRKKELGL